MNNINEVIDFYYRSNYATFDVYEKHTDYFAAFSNNIKDVYYNHLAPIGSAAPLKLLKNNNEIFLKKSRKPAICIMPISDFYGKEIKGLKKGPTDVWMRFNAGRTSPAGVSDFEAGLIDKKNIEDYVSSFQKSFTGGVYGNLDAAYSVVERKFFEPDNNFLNLIAMCWYKGHPIGQVRTSLGGDKAFIYALGIIPEFRAGGAPGKILGDFIIRKCLDNGVKDIYLQTEHKSPLERLYLKFGFEKMFLGDYYFLD